MNELAILLGCSLVSILLSGLVSCLETVAMLADEFKVRSLMQKRILSPFQRRMIQAVMLRRDQHMAGAMILQVVIGVVSNSTIGILAFHLFSGHAIVVYMVLSIYANIVFSRSLPKVLARSHFEAVLTHLAWLIRLVFIITYPAVLLTTIWIKILRLDRKRTLRMSELKSIVTYYQEKGVIGHLEENILQNALMLQRVLVKDIKPSRKMIEVEAGVLLADLEKKIANQHDAYFIVQGDAGVMGVISARDAALGVISNRQARAEDVARGVSLVDEECTIIDALVNLRENKCSRLIVTRNGVLLGVISAKTLYKRIFQGASTKNWRDEAPGLGIPGI
jgi:CBS domain containing-hemolysin-like protein